MFVCWLTYYLKYISSRLGNHMKCTDIFICIRFKIIYMSYIYKWSSLFSITSISTEQCSCFFHIFLTKSNSRFFSKKILSEVDFRLGFSIPPPPQSTSLFPCTPLTSFHPFLNSSLPLGRASYPCQDSIKKCDISQRLQWLVWTCI